MRPGHSQRLDWLVREERRTALPTDLGAEKVFHYSIPMLDEIGDGCLEDPEEIGSAKLVLSGGEVLISKLNPRIPRVVRAVVHDVPTVASTEFIALRPGPQVNERFLRYWLTSDEVHQYLDGATMSVTRSQQRVRPEVLTKMWVRFPGVLEQAAIADYLDAETARIDAIIARKQTLAERLAEYFAALAEQVIWADCGERMPLMYRTQLARPIMYGIVLPGPHVPVGVPIVKGGDVSAGRLSPGELSRTTFEIEAPYARARLRGGDLVFAIRGGVGDVRVVPAELAGANITQDVARVAPAPDVDSRWLQLVLQTSSVQAEAGQRTTGATIRGLNIWELKRLGIPDSSASRQRQDLATLAPAQAKQEQVRTAIGKQLKLLREHRQALITAAVTGESEIPGVA